MKSTSSAFLKNDRRLSNLAVLGVLGVVLGAYWLGRTSAPQPVRPKVEISGAAKFDEEDRLRALEQQVELMRAENLLNRAKGRDAELAAFAEVPEPRDDDEHADAASANEPADPQAEERRQHEVFAKYLGDLDERARTEVIDPAWRREIEPGIPNIVAKQMGDAVRVESAHCASTICQIKLIHPDSERIPEDKFIQFTLNREALGPMEMSMDLRTTGATTMYFFRPKAGTEQESL
jgi:hypothetical protein